MIRSQKENITVMLQFTTCVIYLKNTKFNLHFFYAFATIIPEQKFEMNFKICPKCDKSVPKRNVPNRTKEKVWWI